jgi:quercetin dioxygenase-like cupin family protein
MQTTNATTTNEPHARSVKVHGPDEGEAVWFLDNLITVKVRAEDGAPFGLVENAMPAGSHTPFHRHLDEDEAFYVLEGELTFFLEGGRRSRVGPGAYVHVPRAVPHGFRTDTAVRMLVLSAPDGFVEFAREYGIAARRRELPPETPVNMERLAAIAEKHRIELLGPLPE